MDDFLYILKLQLEGRLSDEQITDQMHIYEDYIQEQLAGGKNRLCANLEIRKKLRI